MRSAAQASRRLTSAAQIKTSVPALNLGRFGDGFVSIPVCFRGASNVASPVTDGASQDTTGRPFSDRIAGRVLNPDVLINAGIPGATNLETLTKYQTTAGSPSSTGDPLSYKTCAQIVQLIGSNDTDTSPRARLINFRAFLTGFTTNSVPQWFLASAFAVTGIAPTDDWVRKRVFNQLAMEAWPAQVGCLTAVTTNSYYYPPRTVQDLIDQSHGAMPYTYRGQTAASTAHANRLGQVLEADALFYPITRAMSGVLPTIPFSEAFSNVSTANDAGGFVIDQAVYGDLTGCTVALENHRSNFAVAVQGTGLGTSTIRVTRNEGGALLVPYSDLRIRISKGTVSDVCFLRLGIGSLDSGVYEVDYATDGKYGNGTQTGLTIGMWEPHSGVSNGKKFSLFYKWRPLPGSNGQDIYIINGGANGINFRRITANQHTFFVRNGSAPSPSTVTLVDTNTIDDTKDVCVFVSIDIDAPSALFRVETRGIAGGAVTATDHTGILTAGATMGLGLLSQRFTQLTPAAVPARHGAAWEADDYIDFSFEANRALFRDVSTLALANNYDRANNDRVTRAAGTGSGTTITPYCSINGNAADRWHNPNRGDGTTTTTDANDTGRMVVADVGNVVATL